MPWGSGTTAHRPQDPAEDGSSNTPTIVATIDAALAAAIVVLVTQAAEASTAPVASGGATAFLAVWGVAAERVDRSKPAAPQILSNFARL